jgi:hypothetical protein
VQKIPLPVGSVLAKHAPTDHKAGQEEEESHSFGTESTQRLEGCVEDRVAVRECHVQGGESPYGIHSLDLLRRKHRGTVPWFRETTTERS